MQTNTYVRDQSTHNKKYTSNGSYINIAHNMYLFFPAMSGRVKLCGIDKCTFIIRFESFIHSSSIMVDMAPIPGTVGKTWEYTLDGMAVHHQAPGTHILTPRGNLE